MTPNLGITCSPCSFKTGVSGVTEARKLIRAGHQLQFVRPTRPNRRLLGDDCLTRTNNEGSRRIYVRSEAPIQFVDIVRARVKSQ